MADSDLPRRSIRDWLFDVVRTSYQTNASTTLEDRPATDSIPSDEATRQPPISAPDARTRLLESYDRSDPICGERKCNHGTFSPRPEDQRGLSWDASSIPPPTSTGDGYPGESSRRPELGPRSETVPSLESSASTLPLKNRRTLYARASGHLFLEADLMQK